MSRIVFITSVIDAWGGCEELWARTVPLLIGQGSEVILVKADMEGCRQIQALKEQGMATISLSGKRPWTDRWFGKTALNAACNNYQYHLDKILRKLRPDLVIVSQSINLDGLHYAFIAGRLGIPYITIAQKAAEIMWPLQRDLEYLRATQAGARKSIFVSRKNLAVTEMQLGTRLTNALVLRNPVDTRPAPLAYPSVTEGYRLACIGRFFMLDKGQDLLIQVLDRPVWRQRDLQVTFIGKGENRQSLLDLIRFYALDNVVVRDHVENGPDIWSDYHALILPSRFEGLPLVLLEAMAAGRTAIVTHAGGSDEIMEHGIHGFIAQPTVEDLEKAMEQAWQRRNEWAQMGAACFEQVNALYAVPAELELLNVINEQLNG